MSDLDAIRERHRQEEYRADADRLAELPDLIRIGMGPTRWRSLPKATRQRVAEALRHHDATTRNETDAPCDCGTVDCAKAALEYEQAARAHVQAPQDRNDADPDIGSPEMPAPGYDAQTRPMPVALAPGQYHHDREDRP